MYLNRFHHSLPVLSRALLGLLLALLAGLLAGCGGGGGGGGGNNPPPSNGNVTLLGVVYDVNTSNPIQSATVTVNGQKTTTAADGSFTLTKVAATSTTGTVAASSYQTYTMALKIPSGTTSVSLGNIYLTTTAGDYSATTSGTVVTPSNGQDVPVAGATVTIGGSMTVTATDGAFTLSGLPVGLGNDPTTAIGVVHLTGYVDKPLLTSFPFVAGANNALGNILIQKGTSTSVPVLPYTITGKVTQKSSGTAQQGITVELLSNNAVLSTTTTDVNGNYYFWVVPGAYSVATFVNEVQGQQVTVNLVSADAPQTANLTY
jgi:hypothetical protein